MTPPLNDQGQQRAGAIHIPQWMRYISLVIAGIASFALAAFFSSGGYGDNEPVVRKNRHRHQASLSQESNAAPSNDKQRGQNGPYAVMAEVEQNENVYGGENPPRLSSEVVQSPFGALNLGASVDPRVAPAAKPEVHPVSTKIKPTAPIQDVAQVQVVQAPPTAPALPFTIIGSLQSPRIEDGKPMAFLKLNNVMHVAHAADVIGDYRVESITDKAVEFTYLPLKQKQILPVPN